MIIAETDQGRGILGVVDGLLTRGIEGDEDIVVEVLDRWLAPDHRYFKVSGDDGSTYILRHDMTSLDWELILFEEEKL